MKPASGWRSGRWQELAGELAAKIRDDRAFEGVCTVIEKLGAVLEEHFPRAVDDSNELSDEVIV